jgi:hypothetical protein
MGSIGSDHSRSAPAYREQVLAGTRSTYETLPPDMVIVAQVVVRAFHHIEVGNRFMMRW